MSRISVLVVAMLAFATPGQAQWAARGAGNDSCGKFLSATAGLIPGKAFARTIEGHQYVDEAEVYAEWAMGYITAVNLSSARDGSKQITVDYAGINLWLKKWCNAHPAETLRDAVIAFVRDQTGK